MHDNVLQAPTSMASEAALDLSYEDIALGQQAHLTWSVSAVEIDTFAKVSGDYNAMHMSREFAMKQGFANRIAHGFLLGSKVSQLVGMQLPGLRCLILEQKLAFPKPIYPGDEITITGTVSSKSDDLKIMNIKIMATKRDADQVICVARGDLLCRCA